MSHIKLGLRLLSEIEDGFLHDHSGDFLLGCTSPDIRAITKVERHKTHFAPLAIDKIGTGTKTLFSSNPELPFESGNGSVTRAFLAGYINHLTVDESWIIHIYQPYFGNRVLFPDNVEANLYDRAVQLDLERSAKGDSETMNQAVRDIYNSGNEVQIDFINKGDLDNWKDWIAKYSNAEFSWNRLQFMMQRMYGIDDNNDSMVTRFIDEMPTSLEYVYTKVPIVKIEQFKEATVFESLKLIKEYLNAS